MAHSYTNPYNKEAGCTIPDQSRHRAFLPPIILDITNKHLYPLTASIYHFRESSSMTARGIFTKLPVSQHANWQTTPENIRHFNNCASSHLLVRPHRLYFGRISLFESSVKKATKTFRPILQLIISPHDSLPPIDEQLCAPHFNSPSSLKHDYLLSQDWGVVGQHDTWKNRAPVSRT